ACLPRARVWTTWFKLCVEDRTSYAAEAKTLLHGAPSAVGRHRETPSSFGREAAVSAREFRELADREEVFGDAIVHDDTVHLAERGPPGVVIDRIECEP